MLMEKVLVPQKFKMAAIFKDGHRSCQILNISIVQMVIQA